MRIIGALLVAFVLITCAVTVYGVHLYNAPQPFSVNKNVVIPKGMGSRGIAELLLYHGVIDEIEHQYVFLIGNKIYSNKTMKAGEYEFTAHSSMREVFEKMANGDVVRRMVTIPEGLTSYEIVNLLNKVENLQGDISEIPPEGSLLPETYDFNLGDTRQKKIDDMRVALNKTVSSLWAMRAPDLPFKTMDEALVLASIVEKETGKASERRAIAGVFINRLKIGMPLQSDPTVIYAINMGKHQNNGQGPLGRRLLSADLKFPSPYNTYLNKGLPPTPIANAGRDAIAAVLNPEPHDFLYFVADGTGGHVFAKTLSEHNDNVAKWRKIRRD